MSQPSLLSRLLARALAWLGLGEAQKANSAPAAAAGHHAKEARHEGATRKPTQVPDANARCWKALAQGKVPFQTEDLGLQMAMMRAKYRFERTAEADKRSSILSELRSYFVKYAPTLSHEIQALHGV